MARRAMLDFDATSSSNIKSNSLQSTYNEDWTMSFSIFSMPPTWKVIYSEQVSEEMSSGTSAMIIRAVRIVLIRQMTFMPTYGSYQAYFPLSYHPYLPVETATSRIRTDCSRHHIC